MTTAPPGSPAPDLPDVAALISDLESDINKYVDWPSWKLKYIARLADLETRTISINQRAKLVSLLTNGNWPGRMFCVQLFNLPTPTYKPLTPAIGWACLSSPDPHPFMKSACLVRKRCARLLCLFALLTMFVPTAANTDSDPAPPGYRTTQDNGYLYVFSPHYKRTAKMMTENIDLGGLTDLQLMLNDMKGNVVTSIARLDPVPLACQPGAEPTDLRIVTEYLTKNPLHKLAAVTASSCSGFHTILSELPLGSRHDKQIKIGNFNLHCSHIQASNSWVNDLISAVNNFPSYDYLGRNNPITKTFTRMNTTMAKAGISGTCIIHGSLTPYLVRKESFLVPHLLGIEFCSRYCESLTGKGISRNYTNRRCEAASYNYINNECRIYDRVPAGTLNLIPRDPAWSDLVHFNTLTWPRGCKFTRLDYEMPRLLIDNETVNSIDYCEMILPSVRAKLVENGPIVKLYNIRQNDISDLDDELARYLNSVRNNFRDRTVNGSVWTRDTRGKPFSQVSSIVRQLSSVSRDMKSGWKMVKAAGKLISPAASLVNDIYKSLKGINQAVRRFVYNTGNAAKQVDIIQKSKQYVDGMQQNEIDLPQLRTDVGAIKQAVNVLLTDPTPVTAQLDGSTSYLFAPFIRTSAQTDTLYRRFITDSAPVKDNNLIWTRVPISSETYKAENFRTILGDVQKVKSCIDIAEPSLNKSCPNSPIRELLPVNLIQTAIKGKSAKLVIINQPDSVVSYHCAPFLSARRRLSGYTVMLSPLSCDLSVNDKMVIVSTANQPSNSDVEFLFLSKENFKIPSKLNLHASVESNFILGISSQATFGLFLIVLAFACIFSHKRKSFNLRKRPQANVHKIECQELINTTSVDQSEVV